MKKIRVGILTGGASAERDISLATGAQIAATLPADRFETVLLDPLALMVRNPALSDAQREQARALLQTGGLIDQPRALPKGLEDHIARAEKAILPASTAMSNSAGPVDVVLLALHGTWGEDGRIQGLLDTIGIPYTGSGVLASALAMDKVMAKKVLAAEGLDVPRGVVVTAADGAELERARSVGLPVFVKPVASGSSVGAATVTSAEQLAPAIAEALRYDERAMVEELLGGKELTVAVIGNDELTPLPVIEIVTKREFFDYTAKYSAGESEEICPARIPEDVARRAQDIAVRAHRALGCRYPVRRPARAVRRLGARGRGPARALSTRSRRSTRSKPRRRRPAFRIKDPARAAAALVALGCAAALLVIAFADLTRVDEITVVGAKNVSRDAVRSQSGLDGVPTFRGSAADARTQLRTLPAVRDARVEILLPGAARITLVERQAVGRWIASDNTEFFIDATGVLFPSIDRTGAPDLRVFDERGPRSAGERIDPPALVDAALRLAALAPGELRSDATDLRVVMTAGANGLVLRTGAKWEIRFGSADRFDEKLALARRFLRDNPTRRIDYVDVRSPDRIVFSPN